MQERRPFVNASDLLEVAQCSLQVRHKPRNFLEIRSSSFASARELKVKFIAVGCGAIFPPLYRPRNSSKLRGRVDPRGVIDGAAR
jgi:hypothetical protein